jgi:hypothetical protein
MGKRGTVSQFPIVTEFWINHFSFEFRPRTYERNHRLNQWNQHESVFTCAARGRGQMGFLTGRIRMHQLALEVLGV